MGYAYSPHHELLSSKGREMVPRHVLLALMLMLVHPEVLGMVEHVGRLQVRQWGLWGRSLLLLLRVGILLVW